MKSVVAAALIAFAFPSAVVAQGTAPPSGIKRTILQRTDIGNNMELVLGITEIARGAAVGRHTHFGVESGYVLEGSSSLEIEGEAPRLLKAGDGYLIAPGKMHDAKALGDAPVKVLASYVVEKGKPFATPAP
jgi:quercetin dioxygenase-like cupin family protein